MCAINCAHSHLRYIKSRWSVMMMVMVMMMMMMMMGVPPSVNGVKTIGEGGVRRLQLIYLLFAVPDLDRSILREGERGEIGIQYNKK